MKFKDIQGLKENQLKEKLKEAELELIKLNAQVSTGTPPENPGQIRKLRRTVAKIKTAMQK